MVERPLCMREVLGSIPRFSIFFFGNKCECHNVYKEEEIVSIVFK